MSDIEETIDKLKKQLENCTAEQFKNRLENLVLLYAYTEKEFERKYPISFKEYCLEQEK